YVDRRHRDHPGGGQLDPEGEAVETAADLDHGGCGVASVHLERWLDRACPVDEQRDGWRRQAALDVEWRYGYQLLPGDSEALAGRGENAHDVGSGEDQLDGAGRLLEDMLAIVDHEQP